MAPYFLFHSVSMLYAFFLFVFFIYRYLSKFLNYVRNTSLSDGIAYLQLNMANEEQGTVYCSRTLDKDLLDGFVAVKKQRRRRDLRSVRWTIQYPEPEFLNY
jgi:hypothetical protein